MPILYKSDKPYIKSDMKKIEEITQEEFDQFVKYKAQYEWNTNDMNGVVNLSRLYVNKHTPSCLTCGGNFRETLTQLRSFYLANKDKMEQILKEKQENLQSNNVEIEKKPQLKKGKKDGTAKE